MKHWLLIISTLVAAFTLSGCSHNQVQNVDDVTRSSGVNVPVIVTGTSAKPYTVTVGELDSMRLLTSQMYNSSAEAKTAAAEYVSQYCQQSNTKPRIARLEDQYTSRGRASGLLGIAIFQCR